MKTMALAICAALAAAGAMAQEPLDPKDEALHSANIPDGTPLPISPDTAQRLADLAEQLSKLKVIRCATQPFSMFYFFEKQLDGSLREVDSYAGEVRKVLDDRIVYVQGDNITSLTDTKVIRVIGDSVEEADCIVISAELTEQLGFLVGLAD